MTNTAYQTSGPAYNTPAAPSSDLQAASNSAKWWGVGAIVGAVGAALSVLLNLLMNVPTIQKQVDADPSLQGAMTFVWVALGLSVLAIIVNAITAMQAFKLKNSLAAGQFPSWTLPVILTVVAMFLNGWAGIIAWIANLLMLIFMIMTIMKANNAKNAAAAAPATGYAPAVANPTSYSNTTTTDYGNTQQTTTTTTTDYNQAPRP